MMRNHRVQYILGKISQDQLADFAYHGHKEFQKNTDLHHIMELLRISMIEFIQSLYHDTPRVDSLPETLLMDEGFAEGYCISVEKKVDQMMQVKDYCNEQLKSISAVYSCSVPIFNETCRMARKKFNINGSEK